MATSLSLIMPEKRSSGDHSHDTNSIASTDDKPIWIYIDYCNLWHAAKLLAAKKSKFLEVVDGDHRLRIDIQELINVLAKGRRVAGGVLFGISGLPPNWRKVGWEKKVQAAQEASIDIEEKASNTPVEERSTIVVVSGSSDLNIGIERALEEGWNVEIYSWSHTLAGSLSILLETDKNVLVQHLDQYLLQISYIRREFIHDSASLSDSNTKQILFHMRPGDKPSEEWCREIEEITRWPFQYYSIQNSRARTNGLVLVFRNSKRSFDSATFLEKVNKHPPRGVTSAELYNYNYDQKVLCPNAFCCHDGSKCTKIHTEQEKEFFAINGGVGKVRRKVVPCRYFVNHNWCKYTVKECNYAHGEEDAFCPNCGKNGHYERGCNYVRNLAYRDEHELTESAAHSSEPELIAEDTLETSQMEDAALTNFVVVKEHIDQQGSVDILSLKSYLIGPSRVGKTTTRRRLTGEIECLSPDEMVPSTGIDAPLTVQLYRNTEQSSVLINEGWKSQGLSQQCQALCSCILNTQSSISDSTLQQNATLTMKVDDEDDNGSNTESDSVSSSIPTSSSISSSTHTSDDYPKEDEITTTVLSLIKKQDWVGIREYLKDDRFTLLHIVDLGGQPEFHEILPLLLHGQALNLIFFNMSQDLDSPYTIIYQDDSGPAPIQYESEFTIKAIIQRALHSISLLQSNKDHSQLPTILIGTHIDKCSEADIQRCEQFVRDNFATFIEDSKLCSSVDDSGEKRYTYLLNNVSSDPSDIKGLRKLISDTVHDRFESEAVPTATLLLYLILRIKFDPTPGWCSLEECIELAERCGIVRDDLVKEGGILQYLHDRFGTILHYRGLKIGERVIVNTNLVTRPPAELFATAFGAKGEQEVAKKMRDTGEIPLRLMKKVCKSQSTDKIPTEEIVELLKSRYILYENSQLDCEKHFYFLPCLLCPDQKVDDRSRDCYLLDSLTYSPILLIPETEYVPIGSFPATVVKLSQSSNWTLAKHKRFRNRIRFYFHLPAEEVLDVELRSLSTHLEISIQLGTDSKPIEPSLIPKCFRDLRRCFDEVLSFYPHTRRMNWESGFYCPYAIQSGQCPHPARCATKDRPHSVICSEKSCKNGPVNLENKHKCWFSATELVNTPSLKVSGNHEEQPSCKYKGSDTPTLLKLKTMKGADGKPLKIVQKIAAHDYTTFGMCLLQDENGEEVALLKKNNIDDGAESVTEAIIRKWLTSDAPTRTYQHLIECLKDADLGALAELIAQR